MRVNRVDKGQHVGAGFKPALPALDAPKHSPSERARIAPLVNRDSLTYTLTHNNSIDVSYSQELAWLRQSSGQTKLGIP